MPLPPGGSTLYRSSIKIENGTYRSAMAMDFQFMPMRVRPFLLFGGSHPYPEQIWICLVDSFDYRPVILFRELRLIGWRIGFHFDVREIHRCTPFDQCQHLFAAAHEKTFSSDSIQLVHLELEQIPAGNTLCRFGSCIQPTTRLDNTCSVGD